MRKKITIIAVLVLVLITAALAGLRHGRANRGKDVTYRTAQVKRGDLLAAISATGTIEPTVVVIVGAQVNGMIKSFGKDKNGKTIDYSSVVEQGTVLARIDDSLYVAARDAAKAQLEQATANKTGADANVLQMKANLLLAQQNWERAKRLGPSEALSQSTYDQYHAGFETATANLAAAEAAVEQAKASMAQARAALHTAELNLGYCTIKAPVKGVIIDRQVNIGQTVVASLSAPSLFLLAKDLKRITVWISVNEADIGSIYPGQPVTFTVDAFPNREFRGVVGKVRLNATMTQNVVTYTVEVNTDNDDGKLLPYLTANARFITGRRENALLVPNAALRWVPQPEQIEPEARKKRRGDGAEREKRESGPAGPVQARGTVWVQHGNFVRPLPVSIGLTDGAYTEITGRDVAEGMVVVFGETTKEDKASGATGRSPLMPQPFGRGQQQGQARPDGQDSTGGAREHGGAPK